MSGRWRSRRGHSATPAQGRTGLAATSRQRPGHAGEAKNKRKKKACPWPPPTRPRVEGNAPLSRDVRWFMFSETLERGESAPPAADADPHSEVPSLSSVKAADDMGPHSVRCTLLRLGFLL